MSETQNKVHLVKISSESKQIEDSKNSSLFGNRDGVIEPPIDFDALLYAYENSSIVSGIIQKIATKANVWFEATSNKDLDQILEDLDLETIFINYCTFGASFSERLRNVSDTLLLDFEPILTHTFRIAKDATDEVAYYQRSKSRIKKVPFARDEVLYIKRPSISDRHYGDSIFSKCIDEVVLLAYITKYYKRFFKGWNIEPTVLYDKSGKLTDEQIDKIENLINDKISWIDNSHNTVIVSWEFGKIDLSTKIDPDKFIALKRELKEDIAIATNFPFELLSPEDSNRATSEVALQQLYNDIIAPMHLRVIQQIKKQIKDWKKKATSEEPLSKISDEDIESIKFVDVDIRDSLEEMKIYTWYKKSGVYTANEIREKLGEEEHPDGDKLEVSRWRPELWEEREDEDIESIKKSISKMYQKDV